jgi:hypothetical protein
MFAIATYCEVFMGPFHAAVLRNSFTGEQTATGFGHRHADLVAPPRKLELGPALDRHQQSELPVLPKNAPRCHTRRWCISCGLRSPLHECGNALLSPPQTCNKLCENVGIMIPRSNILVVQDGVRIGDDTMLMGFIDSGLEFGLGPVLGANTAFLVKLAEIPDVVDIISDALLKWTNEDVVERSQSRVIWTCAAALVGAG